MGLTHVFSSEEEDLYPEESTRMNNFLSNLKIQDFYFSKDDSNDRVYEHLKKYMKKELILFFESKKSQAIEDFIKKSSENNKEYDFNNFVKQVLNIEGGNEIYMNKIYLEINQITHDKNLFEINYFTILLLGKSGVGKSTLINNLLGLIGEKRAKVGVGNIQTKEIKEYLSDNIPFLRLVDTRGIEIDKKYGANEIREEAEKYILEQYNTNNINNFVQCIWYCITGNRFEDVEIELIKNLRKTYKNNKIPIIIVYTQASDDEMIEQMNKYIKDKNIDINFISVLAQRKKTHGTYIEAFGLKELIKETLERCKKALKGDNECDIGTEMGTIITKKIGDYIVNKILENNKIITKNSYKSIVSQYVANFNNIKSEDELLYFIIYLFGISINCFLDINHIKEKTFNSLKNLIIIQQNSVDYINFYNKYTNELIEQEIKKFAVDFLDYQVEIQKQKNKEIKLVNKKTIKELSEIISNFLNHNFYYLAQAYYVKNIIQQYCPKLILCFEKNLNEVTKQLLNNSRIKERVNESFLNKFKNFQKRVKKFYFNSNIKSMKIDSYANSFNFSKDLNKSTFKDNDSRDKINMNIVNNNLKLSRRNSKRSDLNSESNTFKDDNDISNNHTDNLLPSYKEFIKGNNESAPAAKYDN